MPENAPSDDRRVQNERQFLPLLPPSVGVPDYVKQNTKLSISPNPKFDSSVCTQSFSTFFRSVNPSKSFDIRSWFFALEEPSVTYHVSPPSYHQITKGIRRMKASGSPCPLDKYPSFPSKVALFSVHILQRYLTVFGSQGKSPLTGKRLLRSLHIKRVVLLENFRRTTLESVALKIFTSSVRDSMFTFLEANGFIEH